MELNRLKYFYAVAQEGSLTRAARTLRVQQPTISKMLKTLEEDLGLRLVERHKSGIRLTEPGTEIYRVCMRIFGDIEEIRSFSLLEKKDFSGPLSFGVTDSIAGYLLPAALADFMRHYPKVRPSVFVGSSGLVCEAILTGRSDFGVFFTTPQAAGFHISEIARLPFQRVVATAYAQNKEILETLITSPELSYSQECLLPPEEKRLAAKATLASNSLDLQKQLVLQGLGVAFLPVFMIKPEIKAGLLTVVSGQPEIPFTHSLKLVTRKGKVLSKNANGFLDRLRESIPGLI